MNAVIMHHPALVSAPIFSLQAVSAMTVSFAGIIALVSLSSGKAAPPARARTQEMAAPAASSTGEAGTASGEMHWTPRASSYRHGTNPYRAIRTNEAIDDMALNRRINKLITQQTDTEGMLGVA